jgi:hypothetical protein
MIKELPDSMENALKDLEGWLVSRNKRLELVLVGAVAVATYTHEARFTQDIDTANPIDDEDVLREIETLAEKHGLPTDWLSDRASTVTLPDGMEARAEVTYSGKGLEIRIASRLDLIALKAAAYVNRGAEVFKDLEDLTRLKPNEAEIHHAVSFVKTHCAPPVGKEPWKSQFEESIRGLYELVR